MTITTIAGKADVSNGLISRIENGRTIPSLPVLLSIVNALGVPVADFFKDIPASNEKNISYHVKKNKLLLRRKMMLRVLSIGFF
ncbi:helix-turn-helix domain-containing protein [Niabella ginsengisoli]|uniref:helix-turn-helix domain-containing protein n=1 Tax=Niabella ginsengisoli TaxID=522298 RepID=UPI00374CC447